MTHLDSILKTRDITLSTKVCLVKAVVFSVVMYGCESWTTAHHFLVSSYSPGPTCTSLLVLLERHRQYQLGAFALAISSAQNLFPKIATRSVPHVVN